MSSHGAKANEFSIHSCPDFGLAVAPIRQGRFQRTPHFFLVNFSIWRTLFSKEGWQTDLIQTLRLNLDPDTGRQLLNKVEKSQSFFSDGISSIRGRNAGSDEWDI